VRFQNDGMVLWYGTSDAPAPDGPVSSATGNQVTVAVQPPSPSNTVQIVYRVNGGANATIHAALSRQDLVQKVQYFLGKFPAFKPGDKIDYIAVGYAPGKQVPAKADAANLSTSFNIAGGSAHAASPAASGGAAPAGASSAATPSAPPATGAVAGKGPYKVDGYIFFENGLPAAGVATRLYDRGFGKAATKLGEITTDVNGYYAIAYEVKKGSANLEVRVVEAHGAEIALCDTRHDADANEVLNLVAPLSVRPPAPEFARISADIAKETGSLHLKDAKEDDDQQDLTLIASATGWDARLVALAATAEQLAPASGISAEILYGVLRAGLPTNKNQLARTKVEDFESALHEAAAMGIVKVAPAAIAAAGNAFEKYALATLRAASAQGTLSSFTELLQHSGLTAAEQAAFEKVYFAQGSNSDQLWEKVEHLGISKAKIEILKLQGRLFYLTMNSAKLTEQLQKEVGSIEKLPSLAEKDYFLPKTWKELLSKLAGNNQKALAALIPATYGADTVEENLEAYTNDLARRIRMSYPIYVIARMLETQDLHHGGKHPGPKPALPPFLRKAAALGFELGRTPVEQFVCKNKKELLAGVKADEGEELIEDLKRLQRLYQITPSDESLKVLLESGLKSAHDVARIPFDAFMRRFAPRFPSLREAELVFRKAHQVKSTVLSHSQMAKSATSSPGMFATSPPPARRQAAKNNLIEHFPNMENLFGSLDFCQCSDCRSVLGPAAYLVDILQFLDPHPADWASFLSEWKSKHGNAPYPWQNETEWKSQSAHQGKGHKDDSSKGEKTPYEVFIERRPDIPHLPLTCENTNVVLPYIDIVNEVLEYYVAHDALSAGSGYDTGNAKSEELLAEPHNVLPAAYDKLQKAKYPRPLPFDLWLETVRRFVEHFHVELAEILDIFRASSDLFPAAAHARSYGLASVFAEALRLSPAEYALFTDAAVHHNWHQLYGFESASEAANELASAKTLAQRLGLSYRDLIETINTWFVNPQLHALVVLEKIGSELEEILRYKKSAASAKGCSDSGESSLKEENSAFEEHLTQATGSLENLSFDVKSWLEKAWQGGDLNHALVLSNPGDPSNFAQTTLVNADGSPADASVLLRLHLFVRLREKLGWTNRELDHALLVAIPKSYLPLTTANMGAAFTTALLYLAHFKTLEAQLNFGKEGRLKLLVLWNNIFTAGRDSMYAELFLRNSALKTEPGYQKVFDDPLGNYLSQPGVLLKDNLVAVEAALNVTASDMEAVLVDAGSDVGTAALTLDTVSLLYRHALLARGLHIAVVDVLSLKALSGLNPFQPLKPDHVTSVADDYPLSQTLPFVEAENLIRESGFKVEDLNYLLRHQFDPVGKYRDDPNALLRLVKTLATGLRSIQSQLAVPADASSLTDELLQQKAALVLPAAAAAAFAAMWNGTIEYDAAQQGTAQANALDPTAFTQMADLTVSYDAVLQAQKLAYHGVLTDARLAQLQAANASPLLVPLLAQVKAQESDFYNKYLSGFLSATDFQNLFTPPPAGSTDAQTQSALAARRLLLAQRLFPWVQQQLQRQFVVDQLATSTGANSSLLQSLLTSPWLLSDPKAAGAPLLKSFLALGNSGIDFATYASSDGSGAAAAAQVAGSADTTNQIPTAAQSIQFQGYFEVPATGTYRFYALLGKQGAQAQLVTDQSPTPLIQGAAASDGAELSQTIDLKAGVPYFFTFSAGNLNGRNVVVSIQGESLPKNAMSGLVLYAKSAVDQAGRAWTLLSKTLLLMTKLALNERELRYLVSHAADFDNLSFSQMPVSAADAAGIDPTILFRQFLRLARYAKLKREIAGGSDDLIGVFDNAQQTYPASSDAGKAQAALFDAVCQLVANLTRRDLATVESAAVQLGIGPPQAVVSGNVLTVALPQLRHENGLNRLWRALNLAQKLGVPVETVARWATPSPDAAVAREVRHSVKARYERESWLTLAPTIFDRLRQRKRDALVAFIMQRNGFEDRNQLFEYFLIDPGMEPIVQTSRLRLAMSAVQTFVQRCLLNLEPEVQAAALNADQWEWMKRYRVWEANREIFLFPENWLDPEFRDDKTDMFQELEGNLLQGDITNDLAEDALFAYLKKLEVIARLEIVSVYADQDPEEPESNVLHVIGRTRNQPHKYYYRTFENQMWTAWEATGVDIDGDHVVGMVWQGCMNLFWLTFLDKPKQGDDGGGQQIDATKPMVMPTGVPHKEINVQLNWSEYYQGQWTPRGSGGFGNPITVIVSAGFDQSAAYVHGEVEQDDEMEVARINLHFEQAFAPDTRFPVPSTDPKAHVPRQPKPGPLDFAFEIISKNAPPQVVPGEAQLEPPFTGLKPEVNRFTAPKAVQVRYVESIEQVDNNPPTVHMATRVIITAEDEREGSDQITACPTPIHAELPNVGLLVTPFFYQDSQHVFFVEPSLTESVIDKWEHWAIPFPAVATQRGAEGRLRVTPCFPRYKPPKTLPASVRPFNGAFGPGERFHLLIPSDPTTGDRCEIHYGGHAIGVGGSKGAVQTPASRPKPGSTPGKPKPAQKPASKGARK
jgi:hypothetical protein